LFTFSISNRYLKNLIKKDMKKQDTLEFLRLVATSKNTNTGHVKHLNILNDEEELDLTRRL
jgi:hypothetical protein